MIIYIYYEDTDNSCSDPDCCGGPCPSPYAALFSSVEKALQAGHKKDDLIEMVLDSGELQSLEY